MRMWNVDPKLLCKQHLLGEHSEMHMLVGTLNKGRSIKGFLEKQLIDPYNIQARHDQLAAELLRRGMNHKSPLPEFSYNGPTGTVDINANLIDLANRCPKCKQRQEDML